MRTTLTELLLGRDPVEVADRIVGAPRTDAGLLKEASAFDDTDLGIEVDTDSFRSSLDPDDLEKLASATERVLGALAHVRPDLDLEDILSIEGRRLLEGREIRSLEDVPFEKNASTKKLSPEMRERLRALRGTK